MSLFSVGSNRYESYASYDDLDSYGNVGHSNLDDLSDLSLNELDKLRDELATRKSDTAAALSGYGHSGYGHSGYGHSTKHGGYKEECCPLVIDTLCLLVILGSIIGAAAFLNQVILMTTIPDTRKKRSTVTGLGGLLEEGKS